MVYMQPIIFGEHGRKDLNGEPRCYCDHCRSGCGIKSRHGTNGGNVLVKILLHSQSGSINIVTMKNEQAAEYFDLLKRLNVSPTSRTAGLVLLEFIRMGKVNSVRATTKTREELVEEFKRDYEKIGHIDDKGEMHEL